VFVDLDLESVGIAEDSERPKASSAIGRASALPKRSSTRSSVSSRHGRETRYRLTPRPLEAAALWMAALGAEWDERLEALRGLFERR
jgi:hypothetical protein